MSKPSQLDPSIIDSAPIAPIVVAGGEFSVTTDDLYNHIGELSDALAEAEAEKDRLEGQQTVDSVKARILEPYVNKVFNFVVCYCIAVGLMLLLSGFPRVGFVLPDTILAIIAGSTAVSVIGLIGLVVSGLFTSAK